MRRRARVDLGLWDVFNFGKLLLEVENLHLELKVFLLFFVVVVVVIVGFVVVKVGVGVDGSFG